MRRILLLAGMSALATAAMAIPAKPGIIKYTQPDGTVVEITMTGDERGHLVFSSDGLLLADNAGRLEYASFGQNGVPVPSGIALGKTTLSEAQKSLLQSPEQIEKWKSVIQSNINKKLTERSNRRKSISRIDTQDETNDPQEGMKWSVPENFGLCTSTFPTKGSPKGLVVLVEYEDVKFQYGDYDYFNRMLNEEGFSDFGSLGSARDYFVFNSMGQFTPDFDVYGPVTLPDNRKYYGANDLMGDDANAHQMAIDALKILDDEVDFSQYDCDGDGVIDNVFVFYAGQGEHDSSIKEAVWPHSFDVTSADPYHTYIYDGVILDHYACTCEHATGDTRPDGIGTFVHEFSHVMGLPDLYSTVYNNAFTPGPFQVLDSGPYNNDGLTPPNYSSFERCALGWMEMTPFEEGVNEIPELSESNKAYVIPTENKDEYYFFENRQLVGNDQFIPGHGMLVWHIDYKKSVWDSNAVNNTSSHQYVDLIEADNRKYSVSRDGDPFPGVKDVTEFGPSTVPALVSWNKRNLIFGLSDITETEDGMILVTATSLETELPPYSEPDPDDDNSSAEGVAAETATGIYYDLMGRQVANPSKGIYIRDGKKVIMK